MNANPVEGAAIREHGCAMDQISPAALSSSFISTGSESKIIIVRLTESGEKVRQEY